MTCQHQLSGGFFLRAINLVVAGLVLLVVSGCGKDNGAQPVGFGAVSGTVHLPFGQTASAAPAVGARVRVFGGDFDTTTTTDTLGIYTIQSVPARTMSVSAMAGECFTATRSGFSVRKNETTTVDLSLESHAEFDSIPLPLAGAVRMEISPSATWGVLLYDSAAAWPKHVTLVRINLADAVIDQVEFNDLTDAFDIRFIGNDEVVFNFLSASGYGLRFVNLATLAADGSDLVYESNGNGFGGRLILDGSRQHVFVTHTVLQVTDRLTYVGKVFAYSVAERTPVDADNNPNNGHVTFDTALVRGSLAWPYNIAFDDVRHEILVGNRNSDYITAIDWNLWGRFDRTAGLVAPTTGVRKISMSRQIPVFQVWFLDFADGVGIAASPQHSDIVRYRSGDDAGGLGYTETTSSLKSENHFLTIVPSRQSWFTLFEDITPSDDQKWRTAVEERSLSTLVRTNRYESRFFVLPDRGQPRAFAVDAVHKHLYVGYRNRPILEVFCLP